MNKKEFDDFVRNYEKQLWDEFINTRKKEENICGCEEFIYFGDDLVCKKCHFVQVQYRMPNGYFSGVVKKEDDHINYLLNLLYNLPIKSIGLVIEKEMIRNFKQFVLCYNNLKSKWNRKNLICYNLILYCILKNSDIDCTFSTFKKINYKHIRICKEVIGKLGWENIFPYNKMETVEEIIKTFVINLREVNENLPEKEMRRDVKNAIKNYFIERDGDDTDGNKISVLGSCKYVYKKGKKIGLSCNVRIKSDSEFCQKHKEKVIKNHSEVQQV